MLMNTVDEYCRLILTMRTNVPVLVYKSACSIEVTNLVDRTICAYPQCVEMCVLRCPSSYWLSKANVRSSIHLYFCKDLRQAAIFDCFLSAQTDMEGG